MGRNLGYKLNMDFLSCSYGSICGGCENLTMPADEQQLRKITHLRTNWSALQDTEATSSVPPLEKIHFIPIASGGLRDRVDLTVDRRQGGHRLGLFDYAHEAIVDLQGCPQLSPALEAWLQEFRTVQLPVDRGSVRLRVAPDGKRGAWLDLANIDVKRLLDEKNLLRSLMRLAVIEIGQRRKRLVERDGELKLADPILEAWFETYLPKLNSTELVPTPLYCAIGTFTQPGFQANQTLVKEVLAQLGDRAIPRAAEFGAGIGNFTLPLAARAERLIAYEVDPLALSGLRRSAAEAGLTSRIEINEGNFQIVRKDANLLTQCFDELDLLLVDPPRSGLLRFLDPLAQIKLERRPKQIIYVSCFAESFVKDAARLCGFGYHMLNISIVDQFPQSRHYEIVASFSL
jgi:23S rRNA (uracil1939-C5)-methyltransferase